MCERLLHREVFLTHQVTNHKRSTAGYSFVAVHQNIAVVLSLVDEAAGLTHVRQHVFPAVVEYGDPSVHEQSFLLVVVGASVLRVGRPRGGAVQDVLDLVLDEELLVLGSALIAEIQIAQYLAQITRVGGFIHQQSRSTPAKASKQASDVSLSLLEQEVT